MYWNYFIEGKSAYSYRCVSQHTQDGKEGWRCQG